MTDRTKRAAWLAGLLLGYLAILMGGVWIAMNPAPDPAKLAVVTGVLEDLRTWRNPKTGAISHTFTVAPVDAPAINLHIATFGIAEVGARLEAAQGRGDIVTARYRALPLGNRGFAVADSRGDIISIAAAIRALDAAHAAKGSAVWGPLVLYGGVPPVFALILWWRKRSAPAASIEPAHRDTARMAHARSTQRLLLLGLLPLLLILITLPGVPDEIARTLGPQPLGLPPMIAHLGLTCFALVPLGAFMWFLVDLLQALRQVHGRTPRGKWAILFETVNTWHDAAVRRATARSLIALMMFVLLALLWAVVAS